MPKFLFRGVLLLVFTAILTTLSSCSDENTPDSPKDYIRFDDGVKYSVSEKEGYIKATGTPLDYIHTGIGASHIKIAFKDCTEEVPNFVLYAPNIKEIIQLSDSEWVTSDEEIGVEIHMSRTCDIDSEPGYIADFYFSPIVPETVFTEALFFIYSYNSSGELRKNCINLMRTDYDKLDIPIEHCY